ncbi:RNase H domain-containing protein [Trichonephila clavipes]|nr:RNase H domain-containing protein [Trichonephila clavipes]
MTFSEGCKSFEMCPNCSSEPASPAHILQCLGLNKHDLADDPLLVLDFLKVYDVMELAEAVPESDEIGIVIEEVVDLARQINLGDIDDI